MAEEEDDVAAEDVKDEAGVGAPLSPSIPQDEREGAPQGDPSIRSLGRATQGERRKRGGGPKTAAGKEIVRRNPIKHGVLAQTPVIPLVEREEDWLRLRQGVFDFFELEGPLLESLGDRAAMLIWRLQRVARFETEAILHYLEDVPADWEASRRLEQLPVPDSPSAADVREMDRMLMSRLAPDDETMNKVMRYEVRLNRFLLQTLSTIVALKGLAPSGPGRIHRTASLQPGWAKEGLGGPLSETVR